MLAALRLRRRGGAAAVAAVGIAAGACALAVTLGGAAVVQERSLARAVERIPAAERLVRVTWAGVPPLGSPSAGLPPLDAAAREALSGLGPAGQPGGVVRGEVLPRRALILRRTRVGGALVDLVAADGLDGWIRLTAGRLPATCRAQRCEVLWLGGRGALPAATRGLTVVIVGRGTLTSSVPFGADIDRAALSPELQAATGYHQPTQPPLLAAGDFDGLATVPELTPIYRSIAWLGALPAAAARPWSVGRFAAAAARARGRLQARSSLFGLAAPVEELAAAHAVSRTAGRRLLLVGGQAAALLLAFALLAAVGLRRNADAARRRLLWSGARPWQSLASTAAEAGAIAVAGGAAGWGVGAGVVALVAGGAGAPAGGVLAHAVVSGDGIAVAVVAAAAAALLLLVALRAPRVRLGGLVVTPLDVAAVGAVAVLAVALARGGTGAAELARGGGAGALVALLPGLIAFVGAVVCGRLLAPGLRLLERRSRGAAPTLRLAALSLVRAPGRGAVTVGVLVAAVGLGLFALAYRSTLDRHLAAEARQQVPADYVLAEDLSRLVPPLAAATPASLAALAPGVSAAPVLRLTADVNGTGAQGQATLLGVPVEALPAAQARLLRQGPAPLPRGLRIPAAARHLVLPVRLAGDPLRLEAVVRTTAGLFVRIPLGDARGARQPSAALPAEARGGLLVALTLDLTTRGTRRGVPGADGPTERAAGTLRLGAPLVDGRPLAGGFSGWIGRGDAVARGPRVGPVAGFAYSVGNDAATLLRPRLTGDGREVPVLATPAVAQLADDSGLLSLGFGDRDLAVRVVGTVARLGSVDGAALLADGPTLSAALDGDQPGTGVPQEIWVSGPAGLEAALQRSPLDLLQLTSRAALERGLRSEPAARGTLIALAAAGLAGLLLALLALGSALLSDLRDERGELFDLEAQGLGPRRLRAHLRLRSLLVAAAGLLGGLLVAAVLATLVVRTVAATAGGLAPQPPLGLGLAWPELAGAVAAFAVASLLVVQLTARRAFRGEAPGRVVEEGA